MSDSLSATETAIGLLISAFDKYSGTEGDKLTLTNGELKNLLATELGSLIAKANDKEAVNAIFKQLDANADGTVDFKEYMLFISSLALLCHEFFASSK